MSIISKGFWFICCSINKTVVDMEKLGKIGLEKVLFILSLEGRKLLSLLLVGHKKSIFLEKKHTFRCLYFKDLIKGLTDTFHVFCFIPCYLVN